MLSKLLHQRTIKLIFDKTQVLTCNITAITGNILKSRIKSLMVISQGIKGSVFYEYARY